MGGMGGGVARVDCVWVLSGNYRLALEDFSCNPITMRDGCRRTARRDKVDSSTERNIQRKNAQLVASKSADETGRNEVWRWSATEARWQWHVSRTGQVALPTGNASLTSDGEGRTTKALAIRVGVGSRREKAMDSEGWSVGRIVESRCRTARSARRTPSGSMVALW